MFSISPKGGRRQAGAAFVPKAGGPILLPHKTVIPWFKPPPPLISKGPQAKTSYKMAWALVTPASRGIGHALARHLLQTTPAGVPIVATTRTEPDQTRSSILAGLDVPASSASRLDVQRCDLNSESSIRALAAHCGRRYHGPDQDPHAHLRLAFCVPGMLVPERAPEKIDHDSALATLRLNLLAPMMLAKHFVPFLPGRKKKKNEEVGGGSPGQRRRQQQQQQQSPPDNKVEGLNDLAVMAFMSARVGSISDNARGGWYSYRCSKAGLNQLVRTLDLHLKMTGAGAGAAVCVGLHPGTVKTDLSREFWATTPPDRLFDPRFSAERLADLVTRLDVAMGGRCWDWKGDEIMP